MTPELRGDCPEQTVRSTVSQSTRACLAVSYYFFARLLDWAVFRYGSSIRISVLFAYHLEQVDIAGLRCQEGSRVLGQSSRRGAEPETSASTAVRGLHQVD